MAQLPPYLVRVVATILTQALTRKLASSPLFFRIVDRMIHEIDHMPHRFEGRQVPEYRPPMGMRESEWDQDHGEPHDLPSPFPSKATNANGTQAEIPAPKSFREAQRDRARYSFRQAQQNADRQRAQEAKQQTSAKSDTMANELRDLQDKLRELRNRNSP